MKISQSTRLNDNASADYPVMASSGIGAGGLGLTSDPMWSLADRVSNAIKEKMAPEGTLGLSKLLDARRLKYCIPNEAFFEDCLYDRIYVWQILPRFEEENSKTFAGTSILKPETQEKRALKESCRGVIVSAGLSALDSLRTNGCDVGHVINFIRLSPWQKPIGVYASIEVPLFVLKAGDLISSEDANEARRKGITRVEWEPGKPAFGDRPATPGGHVFVDEKGNRWNPTLPWFDESF